MATRVEYTPQNVARGLRDLIAWDTRHKAKVDIYEMAPNVFEARVSLSSVVKTEKLERELKNLLPANYSLKVTWT